MGDDKLKALEDTFKQIEKQFGKGSIMKLGEKEKVRKYLWRSSGDTGPVKNWGLWTVSLSPTPYHQNSPPV